MNSKSFSISSIHTPAMQKTSLPKGNFAISIKDLEIMNSDLMSKDDEYTLVIKGRKQMLINEKKKQNDLDKQIEALEKEISQCNGFITKDYDDNKLQLNYIQNELDYNNGLYEVKSHEYKRKITEEERKQSHFENKLKAMDSKIDQYKSLIDTIEKDNALITPEILKATADMQKFLSEL